MQQPQPDDDTPPPFVQMLHKLFPHGRLRFCDPWEEQDDNDNMDDLGKETQGTTVVDDDLSLSTTSSSVPRSVPRSVTFEASAVPKDEKAGPKTTNVKKEASGSSSTLLRMVLLVALLFVLAVSSFSVAPATIAVAPTDHHQPVVHRPRFVVPKALWNKKKHNSPASK